jgi:AraC-like DNA-binding protein
LWRNDGPSEIAMRAPDGFWSTVNAGDGAALSYWIEAICEAFLEMKADAKRDDFAAQLAKFQFGAIDLNYVDTAPQLVWRTHAAIARSRQNFFYLLYMRSGQMSVAQRGREAVITPGNCLLVNSEEPYRFMLPVQNQVLSVQIPQHWLRAWLPDPDDLCIQPLAQHSPWGATLTSALGNLRRDTLDQIALPPGVVADQIGALIALAAAPGAAHASRNAPLLRRLKDTLHARAGDPDVNPEQIAQEHAISKRYLHLIFAQSGTSFGEALMNARLQRAKAMLDDRRFASTPISEIAWRSGFSNASHFARRFRQRYGTSPTDYRHALHS